MEPLPSRRIARARRMAAGATAHDTQARVLEAASALFAERGFAGATIREIAERAKVNVAAGHYHFGSKLDLYLEAVGAQFAELDARLTAQAAKASDVDLDRLSRAEVEALLSRRLRTMLEFLLGPPPSPHGAIMQREMCDPSEALPVIVRELVLPQKRGLNLIVSRLAPSLSPRELDRCCFSIVGQLFFYRQMLPVLPLLFDLETLPASFVADSAAHVAAFALDGIAAAERRAAARRRARGRATA
ncbi:MAG TPA: CerR family C-terminal domain-containing protein [Myxococcota bacterium]|nr:CerR family C-terminal domain-containing protein [Myxococcota bacterium]